MTERWIEEAYAVKTKTRKMMPGAFKGGDQKQPTFTADDIAAAEKRGRNEGLELAAKISDIVKSANIELSLLKLSIIEGMEKETLLIRCGHISTTLDDIAAAIRASMEG